MLVELPAACAPAPGNPLTPSPDPPTRHISLGCGFVNARAACGMVLCLTSVLRSACGARRHAHRTPHSSIEIPY
eukprot:1130763-Rhodomonas_salina.1